jgi:hyperosmotically inducible periplasmic protein
MLKKIRGMLRALVMPILLLSLVQAGIASSLNVAAPASSNQQLTELEKKVRHSILMLPYYGVFDRLNFNLVGSTVVLSGEVRRAALKDEAEWAVRKTVGVTAVVNNIEILPLSPSDDSIRLRTYNAIFSEPGFEKYRLQVAKPIRIIVRNGNVTLYGVVNTRLDKALAAMAARNVSFVFSVTDNLNIS